jgi:putative ABC transport system permease protein
MRSLLTTLGIIIGVVAIIAVMSIGEGAKYRVKKEIERLGSNFMILLAAPPKSLSQRAMFYFTLRPGDAQAIRDECTDVNLISPAIPYNTTIIHNGSNWHTTIHGINENYLEILSWKLIAGNFFTAQDVRAGAKFAVIGKRILKEIYDNKNPLGTIIRIKKIPFKVIGVLDDKGRAPDGRDLDDVVLIPITTAARKLTGKNNYAAILMSATEKDRMANAARQIRSIIRQRHHLQPKDDDDFSIFTQEDIAKASDAASLVLNILLFIIASISLMVGGIGIMNIMLVTVTERTREIGIRMALGATTANILIQFIFEAVVMCLVGGLLGVILGIATAQGVGLMLGWPIVISYRAIWMSLTSSILVGLFFGYYPAYKASRLNPVQALIEQ